MIWRTRDAKDQFSKVVRLAIHEGPQFVTLRGKPSFVVLSVQEFDRLKELNRPTEQVRQTRSAA